MTKGSRRPVATQVLQHHQASEAWQAVVGHDGIPALAEGWSMPRSVSTRRIDPEAATSQLGLDQQVMVKLRVPRCASTAGAERVVGGQRHGGSMPPAHRRPRNRGPRQAAGIFPGAWPFPLAQRASVNLRTLWRKCSVSRRFGSWTGRQKLSTCHDARSRERSTAPTMPTEREPFGDMMQIEEQSDAAGIPLLLATELGSPDDGVQRSRRLAAAAGSDTRAKRCPAISIQHPA